MKSMFIPYISKYEIIGITEIIKLLKNSSAGYNNNNNNNLYSHK